MACFWASGGSNVDRLVGSGNPAAQIDALCDPRLALDRGSHCVDQLLARENWPELWPRNASIPYVLRNPQRAKDKKSFELMRSLLLRSK
ncbi:hypothetical protein PMIT1313_02293 [Prochlorococcus marinus str. MIT 1313]|uniref:hypothetical protein n=1 Tax=Prochlorococcus TaxID=1218 RepID=UPI0007B3E410|nr:hypothetical protein [Prochlorococcus marinus]KZR68669.1 hypothetical protein PMIT1313_02293 [Prochlorococcus marinus str. MIT 1313]KZR71094.1 hypothetical protein PMIT1318_02236 [Prochlorococcus marinus str. MIT 1318]